MFESPGDGSVPGVRLSEVDFLTSELSDAARFWSCARRPTLAAIYWYGVSQVVLAPAVGSLNAPVRLSADPHALVLQRSGAFFTAAKTDAAAGREDREGLESVHTALAAVSGSPPGVFRALSTDALGMLAAAVSDQLALAALAAELGLAAPRLSGGRLVRQSCCQLYRVPGGALCAGCRRRGPLRAGTGEN